LLLRAESPPRRWRRSSQRGWREERDSKEESARNVYLCRERLMREMREERVLLKRVRRGVRRVLYVDPRA
jgi:hypothetical protein